ncbi:hypothetical protein JB92DRAFT_3106827 [Gautieria morchelliformis]|nr:hypothetical protein JB92DRAFT_3106827 [Gautieria morchelliformis]
MLHLSQTLVALKQAVLRSVSKRTEKLSRAKARFVERKSPLTSAQWPVLDPKVWPCQRTDERPVVSKASGASAVTSKCLDFLPSSSTTSPTSPAAPSVFSEDSPLTAAVLTMPPPCIPKVVISDYDAEMAGRRSNIECQYKNMSLKETAKVGQLSGSDADTLVLGDPKTLGFLAPPGAFPALKRKKRAIRRNTRPLHGAHIIARKRQLPSAPCALDPMVLLPCRPTDEERVVSTALVGLAVTSKSALLPCSSSPSSSVLPSIFSRDSSSTVTLLTVRPPSIPTIVQSEHHQTGVVPTIVDYDTEQAGRRSKRSRGQK